MMEWRPTVANRDRLGPALERFGPPDTQPIVRLTLG